MGKCDKCNHEIQDDLKYCPNCGAEVASYPKPAGFWIRVVASLIDALVFTPLIILNFLNTYWIKSAFLLIIIVTPGFIYKPFMESYYGATLGKMALGLKVIDKREKKLDLKSAYIRFIPFLLTSIVGFVGICILFSLPEFKTTSSIVEIGYLQQQISIGSIEVIFYLFSFVDCVLVAFTYRKRALHDMMAKSFCVYKSS